MHGMTIHLQQTSRGWFANIDDESGRTIWDDDRPHSTAADAARAAEKQIGRIIGEGYKKDDAAWRVAYYTRLLNTDRDAPAWQRETRRRLLAAAQERLDRLSRDKAAGQ